MKSIQEMTQAEAAAFICSHLLERGIHVVLSGGAVVAIYSCDRYVSRDIDLVNLYSVERKTIKKAMEEISFFEVGRYYKNAGSGIIVEFPPGPLSVGGEPIREIMELRYPTGILRLLSPTECIKDRLCAYYFWGDRQCLEQAILVALGNKVNDREIKRWSMAEGMSEPYKKYTKTLRERKKNQNA